MEKKLSPVFRVIILLTSLAMVAVIYLPIWKIDLTAPQYPEGLTLRIYANRIGGDVDVINGLNHYIGMHTLHTRDFVEFIVIPYIIGGFAAIGLIVTLIGRRWAFYGWTFLFLLIAFTSMIDFYRWEYNYGHDLNPEAPIQVPGMAYQPPLLGYKKLLNFSAYSIPDSGGWIFVGAGVVLVLLVIFDLKGMKRKSGKGGKGAALATAALIGSLFTLQGCKSGPEPIAYGQDDCAFCKMTFTDRRFGAEICTKKGKIFKFDDVHCLLSSLQSGVPGRDDVDGIYFIDFNGGPWLKADECYLLKSPSFHTPMGGNIAAFADASSLQKGQAQFSGQTVVWKDLYR